MTPRDLRKRLHALEPTVGCFVGLGSPAAAELLAHCGFDWIAIDAEHSPLDAGQIEHIILAIDAAGVSPLVRVPVGRSDLIQLALDSGAEGIIVPSVRSAERRDYAQAGKRAQPKGIGTRF